VLRLRLLLVATAGRQRCDRASPGGAALSCAGVGRRRCVGSSVCVADEKENEKRF
jgi:hypothetical protein